MIRSLIVYESRYGFTEQVSKNLALVLGPANLCKTNEFKGVYKDFELFVICTPIYKEKCDKNILEFVKVNAGWLQQKKVVLLCSCLMAKGYEKYLIELKNILGDSVIYDGYVGGVLDLNKLDSVDYKEMEEFSKKSGLPFMSYNTYKEMEFVELALKIKELKDESIKASMKKCELKKYIDEFLVAHNTCCLCTGHEDNIRSTPIEYIYLNDDIYMISEGGEKFAHLLINERVSISIYEPFKAMNKLGGMQIEGRASIVDINSKEYIEALEKRGLKYNQLVNLPVRMNVVKISIKKIEFLWSSFKELGYEAKQIYKN